MMKKLKDKKNYKKATAIALSMAIVGANGQGNVSAAMSASKQAELLVSAAKSATILRYGSELPVNEVSGSGVSPTMTPLPSVSPTVTPIPSQMPQESNMPAPSKAPESEAPDVIPNVEPSKRPAPGSPGSEPTALPTMFPAPTMYPSSVPGVLPSAAPDITPSKEPDIIVTEFPIIVPSGKPDIEPTIEPETSGNPGAIEPGDSNDGDKNPLKSELPWADGVSGKDEPETPATDDSAKPMEKPEFVVPGGEANSMPYMPGDANFLPGLFRNSGSNGGSSQNQYWGSYDTTNTYNGSEVLFPGVLSGVLEVEEQTKLKQAKNIKWGDGRKAKVNKVVRTGSDEEAVPGTGDFNGLEWIFPAFVGSASLIAALRRKDSKEEA